MTYWSTGAGRATSTAALVPGRRQGPAVGQGQGRAAGSRGSIDHRRIDEEHVPLAARGPVSVDQSDRPTGEHRGKLCRVADRGRATDDHGVAAVVGTQPEQPPDDVRDMAAED